MRPVKITQNELLAAQAEAFDWARLDKTSENLFADPPADAVTILDVIKRLKTTDGRARRFLKKRIEAGEMEWGTFKIAGPPGTARYYWWKKNATSSSAIKRKSSASKKSGTR
jgi:hypothetical protein